ncbi:MAG: 2-oxoacid:acceptor oxidoreductase family protein [Syntrophothermus sp.]|uniref:2-oxoacid:acceptor oxidoreductase family protein n=1 Tax=Syntrophothermus sp. TaxID=2736299 RepID=UPI0025801659|nr:2-oxoacid:acceptor oxidoreductase family protein [Syntrophothermus sp.]NSW83454.1 2-oxoacid:acceptor oxidoreductase family protein [Syntrophothermus sp.]
MEKQVLVAGFGGQGVLFIGLFLTHAAMLEGMNVSYVPSYGAEMRGGTANCIVTISDSYISSPLTDSPFHSIILNRPSLDRFENSVQPGGVLVVNSSLVDRMPVRQDIEVYSLPLNQLAEEHGFARGANMIILGAYIARTGIVNLDSVANSFDAIFKGKRKQVIEENRQAFLVGVEYARNNW